MSLPRHSLLEPFDWNGLSFNFTEKDDEFLCARDGTGSPRRAAAFPIKYRSPCDVLVLRAADVKAVSKPPPPRECPPCFR